MKWNPSFLMNAALLVACLPAMAQEPAAASFWIEAEAGGVTKPVIVRSDKAASGETYINTLNWSASTAAAPDGGHMTYALDVTEAGAYRIWLRAITPAQGQNSYWVKVDSGAWNVWENITPSTSWAWSSYFSLFDLGIGKHTLTLAYRDGGTKLDKLLVTKDLNFVPSGLGGTPPAPSPIAFTSDTVTRNGALQVLNNRLCNASGNPVQLRGLSTHGLQWYPFAPEAGIPLMAKTFGVDVVRLAMYVEAYSPFDNTDFWNGYMAHPEEMKAWLKTYVEAALKAGVYVVVDWHIHNNPALFTQSAVDFFGEISKQYGAYPNIIYEICNEPFGGVDWPTIKAYATQVIPAIRKNDSKNLIIVGTPSYSQNVDEAAGDPLQGVSNVMYTLHFYAASHKEELRQRVRSAAPRIPIFATEWGTCDYGVSYNDFPESKVWLDFLNEMGISSINWSFSNKDEASSVLSPLASMNKAWTQADLTPSGQWLVQNYFTPQKAPTLVLSSHQLNLQSGTTGSFTVTLSSPPASSATVTVSRASGDTGISIQSGSQLVFTPTNWSTPQIVMVAASPSGTAGASASFTVLSSLGGSSAVTVTRLAGQDAGQVATAKGLVAPASGPWYFEEQVLVQNTAPLTAMTLTVHVARTTDASVNGQYDTSGSFDRSSTSSATELVYTFALKPGQVLAPGSFTLASQINLKGTAHPTSGDTWNLVTTSAGVTRTLTGGF